MKKNWIAISALVLAACSGETEKASSKQNLAFEEYISAYRPSSIQDMSYCSNSISQAVKGKRMIETTDSALFPFLPEILIENGGFMDKVYTDSSSGLMLCTALLNADFFGPVYLLYSGEGKLLDHFVGFNTPGTDEGWQSVECVTANTNGDLIFKDATTSWSPEDSAATVKTEITEMNMQPFRHKSFKSEKLQ
ncbi:MAG: hypothetical protein K1X56_10045 [Flavobacteriales bacterium]|nr:hypothetical protein [Flavobacteriales bacterium]